MPGPPANTSRLMPGPPSNTSLRDNWHQMQQQNSAAAAW
jgi:hypothetical protein